MQRVLFMQLCFLLATMVYLTAAKFDTAYHSIVSAARTAISLRAAAGQSSSATVLILVAPDVDALCAARILTTLLNGDCIGYRVLPVSGWARLAEINTDLVKDNDVLRSVILLNLGALVDLSEYFELPPHVRLHVIDSHRPWNLANLFSSGVEAEQVIVWDDGDVDSDLTEEKAAYEALQVRLILTASNYIEAFLRSSTNLKATRTRTLRMRTRTGGGGAL